MVTGRKSLYEEDVVTMRLPDGYRWATGGGSPIGDCNGRHIAVDDGTPGTLCGRYGPATMRDPKPPRYPGDDAPCKVCVKALRSREAKK